MNRKLEKNAHQLRKREQDLEDFLRHDVRPFLDDQADAEYFTESPRPVPNEAMRLLSELDQLLENK